MTKCKVIALANQKGGTAKTTTTLNLGIGLAHQGRKVLLVDADPQGDLTTVLGWTDADNLPITLDTQMKKILQDEPFVYNEGILHHEEGVDIIPTNIELSGMEISLVNTMSREQTLKLYLADLACESNKGMKLIPAFEVVVSRNKVTIDLGTLTDEYEKEITIHTTATDKETGEKIIVAGKKVTIVDTVTLDGLEEGRKYQLKGWQMLKEENAELLIDGKRVESDYTFVADSEKMKVEISYTFDASELGGQNLVTFEELYDLKNPEEPVKVVEHKDIDDEGQTVLITERKISIHTTATDKNGKKEIEAGKDLTIVDTVTLEGLEISTNYKLSGGRWLRQKMQSCSLMAKKLPMIMNLQRIRKTWKCRLSLLSMAALLEESSL